MKTIYGKSGERYEFEDSDKRYDCLNQLVLMKGKGQITEDDFDIIASMFHLHSKLRALEEVLFNQGFILPTNDKVIGDSQKATWIYEKEKELRRVVRYVYHSFETMWNRSDSFSFNTEYEAGDLIANYEFGHSESDYGRDKETHTYRFVKIKNKLVLEYKEEK